MVQEKRIQLWKFVVFAVVMICCAFVAGVCMAKMVSSRETNVVETEVAKWSVSVDGDGDEIELTAGGDEKTFSLTVTNNSDVASGYIVSLSNIPDGVMVGIDEDELLIPVDGVVEFTSDDYTLNAQDHKTETHTLRFAAPLTEETIVISDEDIAVNVAFMQKEPQ